MALVLAKAVTILLLVTTSFRVSFGAIYKDGDSAGWTNTKSQGNVVDYKKYGLFLKAFDLAMLSLCASKYPTKMVFVPNVGKIGQICMKKTTERRKPQNRRP